MWIALRNALIAAQRAGIGLALSVPQPEFGGSGCSGAVQVSQPRVIDTVAAVAGTVLKLRLKPGLQYVLILNV